MVQCSRHNYQPFNLTALLRTNSESLILFETALAATFLHRWLLHCSSNYHSCTVGHFPAEAATSPAPATIFLHRQIPAVTSSAPAATSPAPATFLHQRLPVLNQRPSSCTSDHLLAPADISSYQFCTSNYQSWTSDHFPAPADTSNYQSCTSDHLPAPVDTSSHQFCTSNYQSCTSNYQSCTSDHLPAPADISSYQFCTSNYQSWTSDHFPAPADISNYHPKPATTFLHQQIPATTSSAPATTSPEPETTFLHQQKLILHQWPPIQRIPVLYQLSRLAPATRSCSNDHHPAAAIARRTLFRLMIRHNKVWPFEAAPLFCHSCLVCCQSLIFQKFAGTSIFIWPPQHTHTDTILHIHYHQIILITQSSLTLSCHSSLSYIAPGRS